MPWQPTTHPSLLPHPEQPRYQPPWRRSAGVSPGVVHPPVLVLAGFARQSPEIAQKHHLVRYKDEIGGPSLATHRGHKQTLQEGECVPPLGSVPGGSRYGLQIVPQYKTNMHSQTTRFETPVTCSGQPRAVRRQTRTFQSCYPPQSTRRDKENWRESPSARTGENWRAPKINSPLKTINTGPNSTLLQSLNHKPLPLSSHNKNPNLRPLRPSTHTIPMAALSPEDEALIQRFIDLTTNDEQGEVLTMPLHAATVIDWSRCLLAKVLTVRTVLDSPFSTWMIKAWGADPQTTFTPVSKACYLVEFASKEEMHRVYVLGPWAYRGDIVITLKVSSQEDLNPDRFKFVDLWVQIYNIPINAVTEEGLDIIGAKIGVPVSLPVEGFSGGRRFIKMKVKVAIGEPIKDKVKIRHPLIGDFEVFCYYEKASHICRFCGLLGHDMGNCADHIRLLSLASAHSDRLNRKELMRPRKGAWVMDPSVIPKADMGSGTSHKRPHSPVGPFSRHSTVAGQITEGPQMTSSSSPMDSNTEGKTNLPIKRPRPAGPNAPVLDI